MNFMYQDVNFETLYFIKLPIIIIKYKDLIINY